MATFKDIVINTMALALLIFCFLSFGIALLTDYGLDPGMMSSDKVNITSLQAHLNTLGSKSNTWMEKFTSEDISALSGVIVVIGLWGVIKLAITVVMDIIKLILTSISNLIGVDPIVVGVIGAMIIVTIIVAAYKFLRGGEVEP